MHDDHQTADQEAGGADDAGADFAPELASGDLPLRIEAQTVGICIPQSPQQNTIGWDAAQKVSGM